MLPDDRLNAAIAVPPASKVLPGLAPAAIGALEAQQFDPPNQVTRHWLNWPVPPLKPTATLPSLSGATVGLVPAASTQPWLAQLAKPLGVSWHVSRAPAGVRNAVTTVPAASRC